MPKKLFNRTITTNKYDFIYVPKKLSKIPSSSSFTVNEEEILLTPACGFKNNKPTPAATRTRRTTANRRRIVNYFVLFNLRAEEGFEDPRNLVLCILIHHKEQRRNSSLSTTRTTYSSCCSVSSTRTSNNSKKHVGAATIWLLLARSN